jgi:hypothetical protein
MTTTETNTAIVRYQPHAAPTYREQLERSIGWEPTVEPLYTASGRTSDRTRAICQGPDGPILAGCGDRYESVPYYTGQASIGGALDRLAAGLGIDPRESPVRVQSWNDGRRFALSVALPPRLSDLIRVPSDPSGRTAAIMLRGSHDLGLSLSFVAALGRVLCANGLIAGELLGKIKAKHTITTADRLLEMADRAADKAVDRLSHYGETLRALASTTLDRLTVGRLASTIAGVPDDETEAKPSQIVTRSQIIDLVMNADGTYVPTHDGPRDEHDALQVLEAATAIDRHYGATRRARDPRRILESKGVGNAAWDVLRALPAVANVLGTDAFGGDL